MACDNTIWWQYEQVAMHFNQLIIQFRVQALGGLVAASAAGGLLVSKDMDVDARDQIRRYFFTFLLFAWAAAAVLDIFYYQRLLQGAVRALTEYEKGCAFQLSTIIERELGAPRQIGRAPATWYYAIIGVPIAFYVAQRWCGVMRRAIWRAYGAAARFSHKFTK